LNYRIKCLSASKAPRQAQEPPDLRRGRVARRRPLRHDDGPERRGVVPGVAARRERRQAPRRRRLQVEVLRVARLDGKAVVEPLEDRLARHEQQVARRRRHDSALALLIQHLGEGAQGRHGLGVPRDELADRRDGRDAPNLARRIHLRREAQAEGHPRPPAAPRAAELDVPGAAGGVDPEPRDDADADALAVVGQRAVLQERQRLGERRGRRRRRVHELLELRGARPPGVQQRGEGGRLPALGGDPEARPVFRVQVLHEDGADDGGREMRVQRAC
ncbi:unnamed protein product, partial [Pelagomonas calceolata]